MSTLLSGIAAGLGTAGYFLLLFIPGAWITFSLDLDDLPLWARFMTGAMLSPLVASAEFFAFRLAGIPFEITVWLVFAVNLPALYLIRKRWILSRIDWSGWPVALAVVGLSVAFVLPLFVDTDHRVWAPHGWLHADAAYMFARGQLRPEDPELAGMILSYPVWTPLAFQAILSWLIDMPPLTSYVFPDLMCLMAVFGFAAAITKRIGGGRIAQIGALVWLPAGTTPMVYLLLKFAPHSAGYCCDLRFEGAWINKFQIFNGMAIGLGMLMTLIYLLVRSEKPGKDSLAVIGVTLCGLGLLYPLLLPAACAVVTALALAPLVNPETRKWPAISRQWLMWGGLLLIALAATFGEVHMLTSQRLTKVGAVSISDFPFLRQKVRAELISTFFFLVGLGLVFRYCYRHRPIATLTLAGAAAIDYIFYAFAHIPFYDNEYKFIFGVTLCLAPFPAIAVERIWRDWPRLAAVPALAALGVFVLGTYGTYLHNPGMTAWVPEQIGPWERTPRYDASRFAIRLAPDEPMAGICDAVLRMTPADTVVLIDKSDVYYPGYLERALYVPADNKDYRGTNKFADDMEGEIRGYGFDLLNRRRAELKTIFGSTDAAARQHALDRVLALNRPVAVITEPGDTALRDSLIAAGTRRLYDQNGLALWLIDRRASLAAKQ